MIKKSLFVALCAIGLTSCLKDPVDNEITKLNKEQEKIMDSYIASNNIKAKKDYLYSAYGDQYPIYSMIERRGDSTTVYSKNEAILMGYSIKTLDGKDIESRPTSDSILIYPGGYAGKISALSVIPTTFIGVGGKGEFFVPSTLGYGSKPPSGVEYNAILRVGVEVTDRLSEDQQIQFYIKKNGLSGFEKLESGLHFKKTSIAADTAKIFSGTSATVKYKGKYITGIVFDQSEKSGVDAGATFGINGVISGFSEAIKLMKKGEKAIAIMPSKIAYGENGGGVMPTYMPLVFEIELVSFQ